MTTDTNDGSVCRICGGKWERRYGNAICEGGHSRGIPMVNDGDRYCICGQPFLRGGVCVEGHARGPIEAHKAGAGALGCVGVVAGIAFLLIALSGYQLMSFQVPPELLVGGLVIGIIVLGISFASKMSLNQSEEDYPGRK